MRKLASAAKLLALAAGGNSPGSDLAAPAAQATGDFPPTAGDCCSCQFSVVSFLGCGHNPLWFLFIIGIASI